MASLKQSLDKVSLSYDSSFMELSDDEECVALQTEGVLPHLSLNRNTNEPEIWLSGSTVGTAKEIIQNMQSLLYEKAKFEYFLKENNLSVQVQEAYDDINEELVDMKFIFPASSQEKLDAIVSTLQQSLAFTGPIPNNGDNYND